MDADFLESEPLLQANCFSAALPGTHALGRVRSPHAKSITTWLVETEVLPGSEQYFSRPQRRGKLWRKGDPDFP